MYYTITDGAMIYGGEMKLEEEKLIVSGFESRGSLSGSGYRSIFEKQGG